MRTAVAVLVVAVLAAGCGGNGGGGGQPTDAASFVECFRLAGFEAKRPAPREESILAFQAKREGYEVEPVNVSQPGMLTPHAFLVFFESEEKAREAMEKLGATSLGEVAPQRRGPAVIGYGDSENRAKVEPAISECVPS